MIELAKRFQSLLAETAMIPPGSRVLVAVSGGADSVALLLLLHAAAGKFSLHLEAAHLDHGLRLESSDDADFVRNLCGRLGVPLVVERRDVAGIALATRGNLEELARQERRDFLRTAAQTRQCALIALGHHQGDQAETLLLRLLRGAGPTGLSGMRMTSAGFVRPLLGFTRVEIHSYLRSQGEGWREDASNADCRLTRNRVRHELLPLLREFNPRIEARLAELCSLLAQDEAYWEDLVSQTLADHCRPQDSGLRLPRNLLLDAPAALAGRLVRAALRAVRGDLRQIASRHVADVLALAGGRAAQAGIDLPGCWVGRRYEWLLFSSAPPEIVEFTPVVIAGPGDFALPDGRSLNVSVDQNRSGAAEGRLNVEFAADAAPFPLLVRSARPGDRLRPEGMKGRKKLQDLFVDAKLTREQRAVQLLVARGDEILWVIGMRRCRGYHPAGESRKVLRLRVDNRQKAGRVAPDAADQSLGVPPER